MADKPADDKKPAPPTLTDDAIETRHGPSRRALLLGAVGGVAAVAVGSQAEAQGATDRDSGRNADPAGRGYSGWTDNDNGSYRDRAGHGRGRGGRYSGWTDRDNGSVFDQAGYGRGGT
jgi:hypothetical protein